MRDVIIIGGGPAGLAAAMELLSKGRSVLLIADQLAGKAGVHQHFADEQQEEYLAGEDVVQRFARQLTMQVDHFVRDRVTNVIKTGGAFHVETTHSGTISSIAVLVATGVEPIKLEVPGAERLVGYGVGYSATTHAHRLAGKRAAVIGSTPRALRGAHELSRVAAQVYLVAPETGALMSPLGIALPYRYNVDVLEGYRPLEITGTANVEELVVVKDNTPRRLDVDAVFVDLGLRPNNMMLHRLAAMDAQGFVRVDSSFATSMPGLFAAGDATTAPSEHILIAIGDGARAAISAYDYVLSHGPQPGQK